MRQVTEGVVRAGNTGSAVSESSPRGNTIFATMSTSVSVIVGILAALVYLVAPAVLIWGWLRWKNLPKDWRIPSILSFSGFSLATLSALLAISAIAVAHVHHFDFYDPALMKIFGIGFLLSGGLALSIGGIWRRSVLQWHAPVCAIGTLAFWVLAAAGE